MPPSPTEPPAPPSARQWERTVAADFLTWRYADTGRGQTELESICAAVAVTLKLLARGWPGRP
jgi:hypothetical protein